MILFLITRLSSWQYVLRIKKKCFQIKHQEQGDVSKICILGLKSNEVCAYKILSKNIQEIAARASKAF